MNIFSLFHQHSCHSLFSYCSSRTFPWILSTSHTNEMHESRIKRTQQWQLFYCFVSRWTSRLYQNLEKREKLHFFFHENINFQISIHVTINHPSISITMTWCIFLLSSLAFLTIWTRRGCGLVTILFSTHVVQIVLMTSKWLQQNCGLSNPSFLN